MMWFLIFAGTVFAWHFWRQYHQRQLELASPLAEHRLGMRYIGQVLTLTEPIQDGTGRVHLDKREWVIRGANAPAQTKVRVIGVDGTVLLVEPRTK